MKLHKTIRSRFTSSGLAVCCLFLVCLVVSAVFSRPLLTGERRIFFFFSLDGVSAADFALAKAKSLPELTVSADTKNDERMPDVPASGPLYYEVRYLPANPQQGSIRMYIDDLLLGPLTMRSVPIFPRGTTVKSCFLRNGDLYVDLSAAAFSFSGKTQLTQDFLKLFKKNVTANFPQVKNIFVSVEGTELYEV